MIAIIDYKSGNVASVKNALDRLNAKYIVTNDATKIRTAEKVIFPGVGRAKFAMEQIKELEIQKLKQPFLGICLGLQLLAQKSEEDNTECLGILPGTVKKFPETVKIPQIGWNKVRIISPSQLFRGIPNNSYFYFVNSYYYAGENIIATSQYGTKLAAATQKNNFYATQFHPEKSGEIGSKLLSNFLEL